MSDRRRINDMKAAARGQCRDTWAQLMSTVLCVTSRKMGQNSSVCILIFLAVASKAKPCMLALQRFAFQPGGKAKDKM
jgi:hypothetical protein